MFQASSRRDYKMTNLCDLHTHSVLSGHAYSSLTENIQSAKASGLKYYGISEHQYDDKGVGAHPYAFANQVVIPRKSDELTILRGIELNILPDGSIEHSKLNMDRFDYCIASMHSYVYPFSEDVAANTAAYLQALKEDYVTILGHIDDDRYKADYETIIKEAKRLNKVIELNNSSLNPQGSRKDCRHNDRKILELCAKYGQPIIVNSDAHICYDVGKCQAAFLLIDECAFPKELVLNYNDGLFQKLILKQ